MIVVMLPSATSDEIDAVAARLESLGYQVHRSGAQQTVLGAVGTPKIAVDTRDLQRMPAVREVIRIARPFKLVNRVFRPEGTVVDVAGVRIGGGELVVIAGPCAVESREQVRSAAAAVRAAGAQILRGGAFKPRTSPYAFQGLGEQGLHLLREAADEQSMPFVTEVMSSEEVELVARYADMLQIGARNMQNFRLLERVGQTRKAVLLKRGIAATLEELLMAAEYVMAGGNPRVVLCERGVRTFEPWTRNTLDLSAIPVLRQLTHLPIIVDPSHATGIREFVTPMARSAVAAGADGLIVEVHPEPDRALCDGAQSLDPAGFDSLMSELRIICPAVRRRLPSRSSQRRRPQVQPFFRKAVVVGTGLIGGSLALALREAAAVDRIAGVEQTDNLDTLRAAGLVDEAFPSEQLAEVVADADLVVLATPVQTIVRILGGLGPYLRPATVVTDVGGTKQAIMQAAQSLPAGVHFIGGHPMAGSERRGSAAADPSLFQDAVYVLCPAPTVPPEVVARMKQMVESLRARPLVIDAARHDRLAAAISHVPYLVAVCLANSAGRLGDEDELALRLAAGGFRDTTRIAASPFDTWADVLATNQAAVRERLQAFREQIDRVDMMLADQSQLASEADAAARYRLSIPHNLPGIHDPAHEIIVRVIDEPGALAAVATTLARESINLRDIQILKIRQDEDGVLRLAFASRPDTLRAAELLRGAGHSIRVRGE